MGIEEIIQEEYYKRGYEEGFDIGWEEGFNEGFREGMEEALKESLKKSLAEIKDEIKRKKLAQQIQIFRRLRNREEPEHIAKALDIPIGKVLKFKEGLDSIQSKFSFLSS